MDVFLLNFTQDIIQWNPIFTYLFILLTGVLQLVFPPFPSDVIIVFEGYLTTMGMNYHFLPVYLVSVAGSIAGSFIVYLFGYKKGSEVLRYRVVLKYINEKHIKRSEKVFHKYGKYGLILSKFIPGTSSIMVLFSGVFKVKKRIYFPYIIFSIFLQQILYLLLGRVIGHNIDQVKRFFSLFNLITIIAVAVIAIIIFIIHKIRKSKKVDTSS
ncbi:membrane protein DedA with SNARE-associated domain [Ruminiclostridium sufflavum DSM 19573]|uniref:Membrane protein DedA with SNARE-associated domain n=1 Tax=Ruminiclostridium sufflavum DSM 19573 TaxID=1121337 RepID=A0A318Y531_9FIRM|nr:DedA family protein [Ruminiclostridium sufflavum]PYG87101.1 membrane protein DedA with SNARE-associated domain [Ruminiclostridium sufflavum DSM 19573]